jgi:glycerol-3-phosphate dehydrogenase
VHLVREDVEMHYSGVRPLPSAEGKAPGAITRRHEIHETDFHGVPVYTLVGGKLTTCRTLAEQVADRIFGTLGTRRVADSRDRAIPGGEDYPIDRGALHAEWERLAQRFGIEIGTIEAVWSLVGTRTAAILSTLPEEEPQLLDGTLLPIGFARWVIREEWVSRLEDLVERRLMLLYHPGLTRKCLRQLAGLLVEAGRLDAVEVDSCVARTRDRLQHYYGKRVTAEIAID